MTSKEFGPLTHGESSDPSRAAVPDGDFGALDDDRDVPPTARVREHLLESGGIRLDVLVLQNAVSFRVVLTGRDRVRSRVFAEDDDFLCHMNSFVRGRRKTRDLS